ncbi:hypothetical protein DPMN_061272 [Dreissena polymorpha]|uniref:Uncharacterized protein n=1 Tax=Dreissena polymorpha TaxID=45954 RepID=A0A9D4C7J4_DREPO|nr:hypothetical protein DPMN_061272 [Dreissena polymorpha]
MSFIVKISPPPGGHDIIGTNILTKFLEDRTMNIAPRVLTRTNTPIIGGHVFQPTETKDRTINEASRVVTKLYFSHIRTYVQPPGDHVFLTDHNHFRTHPRFKTETIFEIIQDIIRANVLGTFHEDWTTDRQTDGRTDGRTDIIGTNLLTKFHDDRTKKVAYCFLTRHMLRPHLPIPRYYWDKSSKFHDYRTIHVASRVFTRFYYSHIR